MSSNRSPRAIAGASLLAISIVACAGSLENPERFVSARGGDGGGVGCDVPTLFSSSCAISGCHSTTDKLGSLDLEAPDPFARLSGKQAAGGSGLIIDSGGDPGKSVLYLKLKSPPPFGGRMPMNSPALDDAAVACVADWISGQARLSDGGSSGGGVESGTNGGMDAGTGMEVGSVGGDDGGGAVDTGGGSPDSGVDAAGGVTFTQVYAIIQGNCLPCHATGDGKNSGMLDMSSQATAYMNLVGAMAAGSQCGTSGETRVVAGNSAMSLLYQSVNPNPPCGSQMPPSNNGPPLVSTDIATIGAWIDQGAPNN